MSCLSEVDQRRPESHGIHSFRSIDRQIPITWIVLSFHSLFNIFRGKYLLYYAPFSATERGIAPESGLFHFEVGQQQRRRRGGSGVRPVSWQPLSAPAPRTVTQSKISLIFKGTGSPLPKEFDGSSVWLVGIRRKGGSCSRNPVAREGWGGGLSGFFRLFHNLNSLFKSILLSIRSDSHAKRQLHPFLHHYATLSSFHLTVSRSGGTLPQTAGC